MAVNIGGCVVPALMAAWQVRHLLRRRRIDGAGAAGGAAR